VAPGPHRSHHHLSTTYRPPPPYLSRPWPPARGYPPTPCCHARPNSPVPLFRPPEANPGMGLLPPGINMPRPEIFFKKPFPGNYYLSGFRYTKDTEQLAVGCIVASDPLSLPGTLHFNYYLISKDWKACQAVRPLSLPFPRCHSRSRSTDPP
jgi:hypothetical protein